MSIIMIDKVSTVEPLAGFEWRKVKWIDATTTPAECCYCGNQLPPESVPFTIYNWDPSLILLIGTGFEPGSQQAPFCDPCADKWFGLKLYAESGPDLRRRSGKPGPENE